MRLPDATDAVPTRRLSVARGAVALPAAPHPDTLAAAKVAAVQAAKDAARLLPAAHPAQLTDAFCDLDAEPGAVTATMTVQAYARTPLSAHALAGAAAALLTLLEAGGDGARVTELAVVQNVES